MFAITDWTYSKDARGTVTSRELPVAVISRDARSGSCRIAQLNLAQSAATGGRFNSAVLIEPANGGNRPFPCAAANRE